jgi:hypothetical protein
MPRQGKLRDSCNAVNSPGQLASLDLTGKHPASCGFQYCLTLKDCFSKHLWIKPLRSKSADEIARALMRKFLQHGFYANLRCDNVKEFTGELSQELDALTSTNRNKIVSYMARQNEVERAHKTINCMIGKLIQDHSRWPEFLPFIQFAYNCTPHRATKFSTSFLHFGRELGTAVGLILDNPVQSGSLSSEYASQQCERMVYATKLAAVTLQNTTLPAKKYYDQKIHVKPISG